MLFRWKTKDGKKHFKFVEGKEAIYDFIEWLETSPDVDRMKCIKGYEVEVMSSPAGYYLGTRDHEGFPNCRISGYCKSKELAPYLIPNRQTGCIENEYCNQGRGCGI